MNMSSERPATPAMLRYARALLVERDHDLELAFERDTSFVYVSRLISTLRDLPYKTKGERSESRGSLGVYALSEPAPEPVEEGVYLFEGKVYKVVRAVHGSGNLYAKLLDPDTGRFAYVRGAMRLLRTEHRMTLAQAKEYGALYGCCCNCGRTLTNEDSIEAGIGPICARRFAS